MRIALTATAATRFGDRIQRDHPDVELVTMDGHGDLHVGGTTVPWDAADIEVGWATADLFAPGAPIRPFFGFVLRCPTLRWLQSPAAGVDDPMFRTLVGRGVRVSSAHVNSIPIAEYVVRAVLDHFQQVDLWREAQAARAWHRHDFTEVFGSTWIVVGLGAIGSEVAARARAFGARVIGVRRHPTGTEPVDRMVTPDALRAAIPEVDVVVLAAPANATTHRLVDRGFLRAVKPGALLINVARGSLVDEDALLDALDSGVLAAAVLDVTDVEPLPPDHRLWSHPGVTITAHNAAGGTGRYARAADLFIENLGRYRSGDRLRHEVTAADFDPA